MEGLGFARSKEYWVRFGWGILVGFLGALGALGFNYIMNLGLQFLWPDQTGVVPFSGSIWIVVIMTVAGFIVGLLHQYTSAEDVDAVRGIVTGKLNLGPIPSALLVSLVSLVGGFSLGPEVPSGMLAAGLATWISEKRKLSDEIRKSNIISSITAAYGGLFTAPLGAFLIPVEMPHAQTLGSYGSLVIAAVAAIVGFAVFYVAGGDQFAGLLRILDLPDYTLEVWHLVVAVILGVVGALLAFVYAITRGLLTRLVIPLKRFPIVRNTLAGLLLGLLGYALPLTLFLGSNGLVTVTENAAELGVVLLIVYVFAKILATTGALATGFIGGPIFPLFFVGGTAGTVVSLLFPQIPPALSVSCMMVAVTAGVLPIPLALGVFVVLITGVSLTEAVPLLLAAFVSFLIMKGFGLAAPPKAKESQSAQ
ncbi:MAG: chloride channel protein [Nitrospirota bacterium]